MLIHAQRALWPGGSLDEGWVQTDGDRIVATGRGRPDGVPDAEVELLAPGFVDTHCHGGGGGSFTSGSPEEAAVAAATHHRHGSTTVVASLVSEPVDLLLERLRALGDLVADDVLGGIHLEGPWLSPAHAGAHAPAALAEPRRADVDRLLAAADGGVRMVTLAPELPGGLDAVRALAYAGVVAAVGHTDADAVRARAAFDAGATVVTHLFNAMPSLHHRRPGPIPVALADERVAVELILDGVHLDADVAAMATRSARGGFLLVSDAMAAAAAADGDYLLGGLAVTVRGGVARLGEDGAIAGSTLTLDRAVRTAVAAGIPLETALLAATEAPARRLGFDDRGTLAPGLRADLVVLDDDLEVVDVVRAGAHVR